jgi:tagatose-6-phosphate ketose/aldose isomerase
VESSGVEGDREPGIRKQRKGSSGVNALEQLLQLPEEEKLRTGVVYTPGEIAQQPRTWRQTFELFRQRRQEISEFLVAAGLKTGSHEKPVVLLVGAGSSDYVGRSLVSLLRRQWNCEVVACPSTDLALQYADILRAQQPYLCISFSRSGDSPEGVAVIKELLRTRPDVHHLVVTCNREGQMMQQVKGQKHALAICLDESVNDRGLAMTSSFSNMVVLGHCLAHTQDPQTYADIVGRMAEAAENFLPMAANAAAELANGEYEKACFVGTGTLRALAQECALKLLELTAGRRQTMSESTLGLRHGPMAALDQQTLLVSFLSDDDRIRAYEQDLLKEIGSKRLVKTRIAVGGISTLGLDGWAENLLPSNSSVPDDYRVPIDVMFGQVLGLFSSLHCGLKPDSPSPSGAISRVVQNVRF